MELWSDNHAGLLCVNSCLLPNRKKNEDRIMSELEPPETHHLNAATGWLELGNHAEAKAELAKISPSNRRHPDVLDLVWRILAVEKSWTEALEVSQELVRIDPDNPSNWIHRSYSLHELKRTQEALNLLLQVREKFPGISTISYNLACYACQLGDLEQARHWLAESIKIRGKEEIKAVALTDPDLHAMWQEIRKL